MPNYDKHYDDVRGTNINLIITFMLVVMVAITILCALLVKPDCPHGFISDGKCIPYRNEEQRSRWSQCFRYKVPSTPSSIHSQTCLARELYFS